MEFCGRLVRDNVPNILKSEGIEFTYKNLDKDALSRELEYKLIDEIVNYMNNHEIIELADIYDVLEAIKDIRGFSTQDIDSIRKLKAETKGVFNNGVYLQSVYE